MMRLPNLPARLLIAAGAVCSLSGPAMAQLLPETGGGADVTVRPNLTPAAPPPAAGPVWQMTPAIGVQQEWTDNAVPGEGRKQASFITMVTPTLSGTIDSTRVTGSLNYDPSLYYYQPLKGENRISQNLDASGHVTVVPELAFVDLRGFAAEQALSTATAPAGTTTLDRQNQVQTYSFSVTPYVTYRIGDWGTAQVGAAVADTLQSTLGAKLPGAGTDSQNLGSVSETASFTSGEGFGRILSNVQLLAVQDTGNGVLRGAYRDTASYQAGYAITHSITALASAGWENISYGRADRLHIDDATWSVGGKWTPNPDSAVTLLYGHQDGVTAASLDASYAPTARIKLFARYSEGVTTGVEQLQNSLATAQLDPLGNAVDSVTGAPLQLTNNFFGITDTVVRARSYSLTAAWGLERDNLQATVNRLEQTPIGMQAAASPRTTGTYGSLVWQHDLSEDLHSSLFGQYGIQDSGSGRSQINGTLMVFSAALSYALSSTLTASVQYSYTNNAYNGTAAGTAANLVIVGLRKTF